ncbi:MAG: hypothetical protein GXP62_17500 [Oligoflexia bacterium]|nr:hypothetical protein [Oligoflexia bacterium]
MSNADAGWLIPNQQHGLSQQLQDGVRALMLDTYYVDGVPTLCHAYCELGSQPLSEGLAEIQTFLDDNPNQVITIIFEDYISAEDTVAVAQDVGLADRAITPPDNGEWPTLQELIDTDQRVLLTAQGGGGAADWYVGAWDLYFDTPYSFETTEDFSCELNRGSSDNPFFLVNHWISDPLSSEENAAIANQAKILQARADACAAQWGRPISTLAVDDYAVGDLFRVVDKVNGVE